RRRHGAARSDDAAGTGLHFCLSAWTARWTDGRPPSQTLRKRRARTTAGRRTRRVSGANRTEIQLRCAPRTAGRATRAESFLSAAETASTRGKTCQYSARCSYVASHRSVHRVPQAPQTFLLLDQEFAPEFLQQGGSRSHCQRRALPSQVSSKPE